MATGEFVAGQLAEAGFCGNIPSYLSGWQLP